MAERDERQDKEPGGSEDERPDITRKVARGALPEGGLAGNLPGVGARSLAQQSPQALPGHPPPSGNLADILERVLDKGIVIAGDIQINLLDIELLTIKLRILIASVERAREMGINWWESDSTLQGIGPEDSPDRSRLERENQELRERLDRLERLLEGGSSR